jgi:Cu(I)/Ag(I) efflux system membrane fusion protein
MRAPLARPEAPIVALISALLVIALAGCDIQSRPSETLAEASNDTALEHALKHADPTYVCPMHPQIVRNEPGSCPICGMDLVEQEVSDSGGDMPAVTVDARTVQNMGVRTDRVSRDTLWKYIDTVGYVSYDEDAMEHLHPRASGWVERIYVRAEGDRVKRGQKLFELYSPDIVAAQEELLIALRAQKEGVTRGGGQSLIESARERLRLLEIPKSVIDELERTRKAQRTVPMFAPRDGIVTSMGFRDGMYVTPALELYTIADLASVWVQVDVFEDQLEWVEPGRPAEIRVAALPGRVWEGEVDYIYPTLNAMTRTLRVRLRFPNPEGVLKPNMFADVVVFGGPKRDVLVVPREAVIPAADSARIVRLVEEDHFQPVQVVLGMQSGDRVEVLSGLDEGDRIVVSGQFLIDSESNLQASFRRLAAEAAAEPAGHAGHQH